jgi:hypothetical protein
LEAQVIALQARLNEPPPSPESRRALTQKEFMALHNIGHRKTFNEYRKAGLLPVITQKSPKAKIIITREHYDEWLKAGGLRKKN